MRRAVAISAVCLAWVVALIAVQPAAQRTAPAPPFDLLIVGAHVLDGMGNPWVRADVGVRGDRVAAVGRLAGAPAKKTVEAGGRYLAPGFIDVHTHAGEGLVREGLRQGKPLLAQGITTVVINPDGGGPVDLEPQRREFESNGVGPNVAQLIGHGSVRRAVRGMAARTATADELAKMEGLVRRAMEGGAFGLSSGLFYAPGSYAAIDEVVALMRVVGEYGGLHTSHIRDEGSYGAGLLASVQEIIRIAEESDTVGVLTHLKALGTDSWGLSRAVVMRVESARARGVQVFADQYAYEASSTSLAAALVPRWAEADGEDAMRKRVTAPDTRPKILAGMRDNLRRRGGPASLLIAAYAPQRRYEGLTLAQIADDMKLPPEQAAAAMVVAGRSSVVSFNMAEPDIEEIMRQPWTMTSSDGGLVFPTEGRPHPRNYGAFPRKLTRYVREEPVVGLEFAIRSMTSLPALVFGIADRGTLRVGAMADLVLFDLTKVDEVATYADPHQLARGMDLVTVNGSIVLENGEFTAVLPGRVLRKSR